MSLERLSIELSQRCSKGCWFCYSGSHPAGETHFSAPELEHLLLDAAANGVRAVSFGGGEPLEAPTLWPLLAALQGKLFRSLTTSGLPLLEPAVFERLVAAKPDKVHVSIHFPGNAPEVTRVIQQVHALARSNIPSGINLLVRASQLPQAKRASAELHAAGIGNERIVYLPMRGQDTPTPAAIAEVAQGALPEQALALEAGEPDQSGQGAARARAPFQSMTCLTRCQESPRFCAVRWDGTVAWCSYTARRRPLPEPTYAGLVAALHGLGLAYCGDRPLPLRLARS